MPLEQLMSVGVSLVVTDLNSTQIGTLDSQPLP
jgi:hypothetical protein